MNEKTLKLIRAIEVKEAFDKAYDIVKEEGNEEEIQNIRAEARVFLDSIDNDEDVEFKSLYRMMTEARKVGNDLIDIYDPSQYRVERDLIQMFRNYGIKQFTYSSTWSSATESAWEFLKLGCKLEGMTEVHDRVTSFLSDEYELIPAYLFSVN